MMRGSKESSPSHSKRLLLGEIVDIPMDLIVEILKKLPAKSLMRFQCVAKQWSSIISSSRDFIDSIIARSSAQPLPRDTKLIFHHCLKPSFFSFSSTYSENRNNESASSGSFHQYQYQSFRGLILFSLRCPPGLVIYNPTTRQCFPLPNSPHESTAFNCFFGYDPLEDRYKVLSMMKDICQVFTLGNPIDKQYWRIIKGIGHHDMYHPTVCINGTIYYRAMTTLHGTRENFLVSFDVRSEKFGRVEAPPKTPIEYHWSDWTTLIKYQGKLGTMCCSRKGVEIWVMEDGEKKQEWSKIIHYEMGGFESSCCRGVTHGGEIVFVDWISVVRKADPLYVYYYDPQRNSLRRIDVKGTRVEDIKHRKRVISITPVLDHVENTMRF